MPSNKITFWIPDSKMPAVTERARRERMDVRTLVLVTVVAPWLAELERSTDSDPTDEPVAA